MPDQKLGPDRNCVMAPPPTACRDRDGEVAGVLAQWGAVQAAPATIVPFKVSNATGCCLHASRVLAF